MLRVDLGQVHRDGSVLLEARVPSDSGLWHDSELTWAEDVDLRLSVAYAGTGEVVVRGGVRGVLAQECRRCLRPVTSRVAEELTMVFVSEPADEDGGDGDTYPFDAAGVELDLSSAVREELILAINPYVVCGPECRGLCPKCGANLNEESCDCAEVEADPRWEALRALQSE